MWIIRWFSMVVKTCGGITAAQPPYRSETNGIAERAVRRVKQVPLRLWFSLVLQNRARMFLPVAKHTRQVGRQKVTLETKIWH